MIEPTDIPKKSLDKLGLPVRSIQTAALVSMDGSIESMCIPYFDSPSKQAYAPNSNVLVTKFLSERGVGVVTDLLVPKGANLNNSSSRAFLPWLIRKVESIRGTVPFKMECAPAFNYCRDKHTAEIVPDDSSANVTSQDTKVVFKSPSLKLDLRMITWSSDQCVSDPEIKLQLADFSERGLLGPAATCDFELEEGQCVVFIMRESLIEALIRDTTTYWKKWIGGIKYSGRWRQAMLRSALTLKMLVFEETGAIVAAPTFSLPEFIGGQRNWDYRFTWVRDSSFTLYALIRLGFTEELTGPRRADAFVNFILERLKDRNSDGSLQIVYTIHGGKDLEEIELNHLAGHKGSKPVRIGNGAADHLQLDIYGELLDCIYLAQKYSKPLGWDSWVAVRQVVDYVCSQVDKPDLSIWEVRGKEKNFTYSKIMMWVAIDRGIRLADKRCLPCPNRSKWLETRDRLYETIQHRAWNPSKQFFAQSYEDLNTLDSSVLIMPLVFFISAADPRFTNTLDAILKTPEKGGLTANNSVYRYNAQLSDDGVGGEEGAFSLCTLWCVEALTRAGVFNAKYLDHAMNMFMDFLGYGNHVELYSEEISAGGEGLGNTPQAFSHVTLISAGFNLDRALSGSGRSAWA
ncbi:glycosyl hydrolase [Cryptococcus gattii E566]|uniref:Glycosyl hydrolase, putative n=2 Tax=Cryptococcus gattii TaxID=37769 RepID=E6R5K1_CRYGW|nr:Glycosyl hydrolase, putative [Cryptococcus gattii WM276]ADV21539.1 Glycosyl hydrolase, putative [Cryptococcus gattii WM276]KIR81034.1 glycosyl hydrolase [Cryptococcus gattii EJB2]KIY34064.1 glycosyl hydrolase [Cryptococcus gattii E566]KJE03807.1 glycosyl hydrolase [Cryptococcus gattii NT-10]